MAASLPLRGRRPDLLPRPGSRDVYDDDNLIGRLIARLRPDEGFIALALVMLLAGTMAWSISNARWILGRDDLTAFLIWVALAAAGWGYVASKLPIAPWVAHAIGSIVGAFVLIEVVGSILPGATPGLVGWFKATADSVTQAYLDLAWRHHLSTLQYGHFCLILGVVVWGTAQAASYDIFGYHRAVNGVLLLGVVFLVNMSLTVNDQYQALVVFSAAALALLLLAHAADEQAGWIRHRIWRGGDFRAPHLQGGLAFATLAICGAIGLTTVASSAPLAGSLASVGQNFSDAATWLSGFLPSGGQTRYQPSADFGTMSPVSSSFHVGLSNVFTVGVPNADIGFHWRLVSYDTFQSTGWSVGPSTQDEVIAGGTLDGGTLDLVNSSTPGRTQVSYVVHVQDSSLKHLVVANEADSVNVAVQRSVIGTSPSDLNVVALSSDATDYRVSSYIPAISFSGGGLTEWLLEHAAKAYPTGLLDRYTQGVAFVGAPGHQLLREIASWAKSQGNPFNDEYDVAKAIQAYLQSSRFTYKTDITGDIARCTGLSAVDCFATIREGFCEQYATTMTMLMRLDGYPARYVQGYLPGHLDPNTLIEQITSQQKHAWVEVYFPTYGWIPFDPTGGSVGQPTILTVGSAVSPSPFASEPAGPSDSGAAAKTSSATPGVNHGGAAAGDNGAGPVIIGISATAGAGTLLVILWLRRARRLARPDAAYRSVVSLASRLGYRPKPSQTVLEYTGMLAGVVPRAREPLEVVATAAVEVAYGRRELGIDRLVKVTEAQRRIRGALLRLFFRLPRFRRVRR
jgi:hypothetical protein